MTGSGVKFRFSDGHAVDVDYLDYQPKLPVSALRGMLQSQRRVTVEDMNEAVAAGAIGEALNRERR